MHCNGAGPSTTSLASATPRCDSLARLCRIGYIFWMKETEKCIRSDGRMVARRAEFLGALRVGGRVGDASAWIGMSSAGAYALAKREPGFAAAWDAALVACDADRRSVTAKPLEALGNTALLRRLRILETKLNARPKGVVAQQNQRWA